MALLDLLVKDVADRFGIGDKARLLMGALLESMNSEQTGGLLGFLDRFNRVGLNDLVSSWVSVGPPKPLSTAQLESALGKDTAQRIAANVGLAQPTTSSALAYLIPQVVDQLTPDGYAPNGLPNSVRGYLPGAAGVAVEEPRRRVPAWLGILPLLALAGVAALGYRSCLQGPEHGAESGPAAAAPSAAPTPPPAVTPSPAPAPIGSQTFTADDAVRAANEKAAQAFQQLMPGFRGEELISVLNLIIVNFATGSAQIPPDSRDLIEQAAAALKAAPAGARVEIGGHTDSAGDADANLRLSQARAEAVREALIQLGVDPAMLQAKGYGGGRPINTNETEEGRFQNRRIEYSLIK